MKIRRRVSNDFHLLLEVPPRPKAALTDEELLKRLGALYPKAFLATVAKELAEARHVVAQGMATDGEAYVQQRSAKDERKGGKCVRRGGSLVDCA